MTCRGHNDHSAHCKPNKSWGYAVATSMIRGRVAGSCFTLTKTNQPNSCHEGIVLERKRLTIGLRHSVSERAVRVFLAWGVGSLPKTLRKAIPKGKRKESRIPTIHLSGAKMLVLGMVTTILLFQECHRIATHQHWKKSQDLAFWRKKRMFFFNTQDLANSTSTGLKTATTKAVKSQSKHEIQVSWSFPTEGGTHSGRSWKFFTTSQRGGLRVGDW